jgi:hypothetical protein
MAASVIEGRIKWASLLVAAGQLVQVLAQLRIHPLSFVAFLVIGCPLVAAGSVLDLASVLLADKPESK